MQGSSPCVNLAGSWLQQRTAQVVVEGQRLDKMLLRNMVFQGTLGNLFYEDARRAIHEARFVEIVYADDVVANLGHDLGSSRVGG